MAAVNDVDRVSSILDAAAQTGLRPVPVEVVRVPKGDNATRPAADMSTEDQVILSALVYLIRAATPSAFVLFSGEGSQTFSEFEHFPISQENVEYVLEADVANFYENVSHERLAYEIIGLTGRADVAEGLTRLLESWMGDTRGLPQGPVASNALADIYISPAARALDRAGYRFSRYSDDFRVLASTWPETKDAQLALETALHGLGLAAAPGKLRTPKLQTYKNALERVNDPRLVDETFREAVQEVDSEEYAPGLVLEEVTPEVVAHAETILDEVLAQDDVDVLATRLLRRALPRLGAGRSTSALESLPVLVGKYAHATTSLARYVRALIGTDVEKDAIETVLTILNSDHFKFPWQVGWLLNAICPAEESDAIAGFASTALVSSRLPWFARGQAALALALHGQLPRTTDYVSIYERATRASRPDFVAAVAVANPQWAGGFLRSVSNDSPVLAVVSQLPPEVVREWV